MWIIADTNQVAHLPLQIESGKLHDPLEGITLPAHVLSEILLQSNPVSCLSRLWGYNVRLGLEPGEVLQILSTLSIEEILDFEPFPIPGTEVSRKYSNLISALRHPHDHHIEWAKTVKSNNRAFMQKLLGRPENFRRDAKNAGIRKIENVSEAVALAGRGSNSFLGSVIMPLLDGRYRVGDQEVSERLYEAIMRNEYIERFMKAILVFVLSISRYWKNEGLNYDVLHNRDDWTDITLPLYASDGDLILTKDTKLRLTIQTIEDLKKVTVVTSDDLI
jgi:hypothetical protein